MIQVYIVNVWYNLYIQLKVKLKFLLEIEYLETELTRNEFKHWFAESVPKSFSVSPRDISSMTEGPFDFLQVCGEQHHAAH